MIHARSRFDVILGGAAGYIIFAFFILLTSYYIAQHLRAPEPALDYDSAPPQIATEPAPGIKQVEKSLPVPSVKPGDNWWDLSAWIPKSTFFNHDLSSLEQRHLTFPLRDVDQKAMTNSFEDPRPGGRSHEGVDILAPRNTPIVAVGDGTIAKLWNSHDGGTTIYQFDPTGTYVYYYAHLESYANGLKEGEKVRAGQVIGFVGTSGNAPKNTPHLHFAIYKVTEPGHWYHGQPLNPYPILSANG